MGNTQYSDDNDYSTVSDVLILLTSCYIPKLRCKHFGTPFLLRDLGFSCKDPPQSLVGLITGGRARLLSLCIGSFFQWFSQLLSSTLKVTVMPFQPER